MSCVLPVFRAESSVLLTQSPAACLLRTCFCWIADPHRCTWYNAFRSKDSNYTCIALLLHKFWCLGFVKSEVLEFTGYKSRINLPDLHVCASGLRVRIRLLNSMWYDYGQQLFAFGVCRLQVTVQRPANLTGVVLLSHPSNSEKLPSMRSWLLPSMRFPIHFPFLIP